MIPEPRSRPPSARTEGIRGSRSGSTSSDARRSSLEVAVFEGAAQTRRLIREHLDRLVNGFGAFASGPRRIAEQVELFTDRGAQLGLGLRLGADRFEPIEADDTRSSESVRIPLADSSSDDIAAALPLLVSSERSVGVVSARLERAETRAGVDRMRRERSPESELGTLDNARSERRKACDSTPHVRGADASAFSARARPEAGFPRPRRHPRGDRAGSPGPRRTLRAGAERAATPARPPRRRPGGRDCERVR